MNVLALDLGTNTGYAYNQGAEFFCGTWKLATPKEIRELGKTRMNRRCDIRVLRLSEHIKNVPSVDLIIFEDVLFCSTTYACQLWASLRAAIWLSGRAKRIDCVSVQALKIFATGRGNAKKEEMAKAALLSGVELPKLDDNGIDAFWLHRWAHERIKLKIWKCSGFWSCT